MATSASSDCSVTAECTDRGQTNQNDFQMDKVLNMKMMDLKYIVHPFHEIIMFLCPQETLQDFIAECGFSMNYERVCEAVMKNQPKTLPAKSFLELYFRDNNTTLREFMRRLLRMEQRYHKVRELVTALWNAALFGNSKYFRKLYKVK